ncbi:MAG: DUF429 domain-containing protein [bacterium]|jgi:hypothetical protein|nr:DUF429 domain-containing protein [Betaproteobacteria bacterium]
MPDRFRLLGVDFTSAPRRAKPITVACARLSDGSVQGGAQRAAGDGASHPLLQVDAVEALDTFAAFEALLDEPGPWIGGFDFPFGLPRSAVADLGWPSDWRDLALACARMPRPAFRASLDAHRQARAVGDRYVHRAVDRPAASHSPLKLVNPPVALMFLEGAPRLARAGITVAGHVEGDARRVAVEAYPGFLVRAITRQSYKSDTRAKQTVQRHEARATILAALGRGEHPLGLRVSAPRPLLDRALADASGDTLDAIVCAVQAGWALRQPRFGIPPGTDPLEGWIAGVPLPAPGESPGVAKDPVQDRADRPRRKGRA